MCGIKERFAQFADEYLKFDQIENPLHSRKDMCAFLLLAKLCPGTGAMVYAADHDIIFLDAPVDELAAAASDEDIKMLVRCGVRCTGEWLEMFV